MLPEPDRSDNGYRVHQLPDLVRLLRVRRLVALGLSLEEVTDALADAGSVDLREVLAELEADLAVRQERVRVQRERIAELLASDGDLTLSPEVAEVLGELTAAAGSKPPRRCYVRSARGWRPHRRAACT